MTGALVTLGFILVLAGSFTAIMSTTLDKNPPIDFVGYCLLGGALCYGLVWLGGSGAWFMPAFFIVLSLIWWYSAPRLLVHDRRKPEQRNPWDYWD